PGNRGQRLFFGESFGLFAIAICDGLPAGDSLTMEGVFRTRRNAMFRLDLGPTPRYCDGMSRRSFLQLGVAGMASVGLPQLLRAREQSAEASGSKKDTSVILIWLDGGPGHMDMYDMKPDAPAEYRGLWKPIKT